jgi:hypothetical protein
MASHCVNYSASHVSLPADFFPGDINNNDTGRLSTNTYDVQTLINFGPNGRSYPSNCPLK